jgi:hypothetical protein
MTHHFDGYEAGRAGTNNCRKKPRKPRGFNGESCECRPGDHRAGIEYLVGKRKEIRKLRSYRRWKVDELRIAKGVRWTVPSVNPDN